MKIATLFAALLCFLLASSAAAQNYSASLSGANVVPPNGSMATGSGTFVLDGSKMFSYNITFSGFIPGYPETGAHVHGPAPAGMNAPPVFTLPAGTPKIGVYGPLTAQEESDLNAGLWYVQIHSTLYPNGEIRGQILMSTVANETSSWGQVKSLYEER